MLKAEIGPEQKPRHEMTRACVLQSDPDFQFHNRTCLQFALPQPAVSNFTKPLPPAIFEQLSSSLPLCNNGTSNNCVCRNLTQIGKSLKNIERCGHAKPHHEHVRQKTQHPRAQAGHKTRQKQRWNLAQHNDHESRQ